MKHILNNMSEEEKNAIREQHTGGMKVMTENFNKLINSKLGDSKPLVNEAAPGVEPVYDRDEDQSVATIFFKEGQTTLPPKDTNDIINFISNGLRSTIPTLQKFYKSGQKIPPFIDLYVGTSSTGSATTNRNVAFGRMDYLEGISEKAMAKFNIRADVAFKFITQNFEDYQPSKVDANFYDTTMLKPKQSERNCFIVVKPLETKGLNPDQVGKLQGNLIDASSIINSWLVDNVDESAIVAGIRKLQTYSDITDLHKALINARMGSLESFLNKQLFDDASEKYRIVDYLNGAAKRSNKGPIAKLGTSGDIAIMI
jgi:hypothetical protein